MMDIKSRIERISEPEEVTRRLEAGESLAVVAQGLDPLDLIAALARPGLGAEGSEGPSLIQTRPKYPRLEQALTDDSLAAIFPGSNRPARLALAAGLLQILDFWDASHAAAQEADDLGETGSAAYWHLIAHRREPDPGNAQYWARRVGHHPIHARLALVAETLPEPWGKTWSPTSLIDLATRSRSGTREATLARKLQRIEMIELLEESVNRVMKA